MLFTAVMWTVFTTKETIAERTAAVVLAIVSGAGAQSEIFPEAEVQVDRNLADKLNMQTIGRSRRGGRSFWPDLNRTGRWLLGPQRPITRSARLQT